jgi:hypothetical protein
MQNVKPKILPTRNNEEPFLGFGRTLAGEPFDGEYYSGRLRNVRAFELERGRLFEIILPLS